MKCILNCQFATQAEVLAVGSLTQTSSSAPLHFFLLCEPSAMGRALLAGLNNASASVTYAATRQDFAAALMIRDSRRHVDPRAFARAEEELHGSEGVTFALRPRPEALDVLRAWEKKNEDLGRY